MLYKKGQEKWFRKRILWKIVVRSGGEGPKEREGWGWCRRSKREGERGICTRCEERGGEKTFLTTLTRETSYDKAFGMHSFQVLR